MHIVRVRVRRIIRVVGIVRKARADYNSVFVAAAVDRKNVKYYRSVVCSKNFQTSSTKGNISEIMINVSEKLCGNLINFRCAVI